jgi:glycosyltransferase involved in cell wall biosynthesis
MAAGVPVVGSNVGDLSTILASGRGWLIEHGSAAALTAAFASIAGNPEEAGRRASRARAWFVKEASEEALRARFLPIVEQLLRR